MAVAAEPSPVAWLQWMGSHQAAPSLATHHRSPVLGTTASSIPPDRAVLHGGMFCTELTGQQTKSLPGKIRSRL